MGSFVEKSLISGEKIEAEATVSWLSQLWLFMLAVSAIVSLIQESISDQSIRYTIFFVILFIVIPVLNVLTTELAVTNKKVIGKTGVIRRESADFPLEKLESINIDQGLVGRILGYGRVSIRGIGGNAVSIPRIKDPMSFRRVVMGLMDKK